MQPTTLVLAFAATTMAAQCDPTAMLVPFNAHLVGAVDCGVASGFSFVPGAVPTADEIQKMVQAPACTKLYSEMQATAGAIQPSCLMVDGSDITMLPHMPLNTGLPKILQTIGGGSSGSPGNSGNLRASEAPRAPDATRGSSGPLCIDCKIVSPGSKAVTDGTTTTPETTAAPSTDDVKTPASC